MSVYVAYFGCIWIQSNGCRTVLILGMGNGVITTRLLSTQKLLTILMVLSFFGSINVGKAHSESACHCNTPKWHKFWISFLVTSKCFLGIGNGFLTIRLFSSLKSLTTLMVLSFFGIIKVGKAHSESACHCNTPKLHNLWMSFLVPSK